jgi:hypothetical protein
MTTRVWTTKYVRRTVVPALTAAGYLTPTVDDCIKVLDPDTGECHMRAMPKGGAGFIVTYDARLLDENADREYPNGI